MRGQVSNLPLHADDLRSCKARLEGAFAFAQLDHGAAFRVATADHTFQVLEVTGDDLDLISGANSRQKARHTRIVARQDFESGTSQAYNRYMSSHQDTNESVWKSDETIKHWSSTAAERERKRAESIRLIAQLLPFDQQDEFTFLDLGAGTGMAARGIMDYYPRAQAVLADYSPQMMGEGEKILQSYAGRYRYVEFDMKSSDWPAAIPAQLDAAVTSQCVHHLPDERKKSLFREIFERLKPGAWYVNFDPVRASDVLVEEIWQHANERIDPEAAHRRMHRGPQEQAMWENHVRYMIDLDTQLGFFRAAGFEAVDVYWKQLDYVIYGGRKPRP